MDCVVRQRRFAEQDIAAANAADLNLIIADLGIKNVKRCALDDDLSEVVILVAITNAELFSCLTARDTPMPCDFDGDLTVEGKLNFLVGTVPPTGTVAKTSRSFWRLRNDVQVGCIASLQRLAILNKRKLAGVIRNSTDRVEQSLLFFNR